MWEELGEGDKGTIPPDLKQWLGSAVGAAKEA